MDEPAPPTNDDPKTPESRSNNPTPLSSQPSGALPLAPDTPPVADRTETKPSASTPTQQFTFAPQAGSPLPDAEILAAPREFGGDETIAWTASEFIAHHKSPGWYAGFALMAVAIAALVFLLTRDLVGSGAVILVGIALTIFGARQPRQLQYALSNDGLLVANKYFPFDNFRSFAVVEEGAFSSVVFMPLKRFGQLITIYFDPHDEEKIINLLANRLPVEDKDPDVIDRLMKRLHF